MLRFVHFIGISHLLWRAALVRVLLVALDVVTPPPVAVNGSSIMPSLTLSLFTSPVATQRRDYIIRPVIFPHLLFVLQKHGSLVILSRHVQAVATTAQLKRFKITSRRIQ
jgi:hypothetical protein